MLSRIACVFCGYEPIDPDGIYSEALDLHACADCEAIAVRILTTAAEAGEFVLSSVRFAVRPSPVTPRDR